MEKKKRLLVSYSQTGHYMYPEDTWEDMRVFESESELFRVIKEMYKRSAATFNDYPFGGSFHPSFLEFHSQNIIIDEDGEVFLGNISNCNPPSYFSNTLLSFDEWKNDIKERLPRLRAAREARWTRERELAKLTELQEKYHNLSKDE